MIRYVWPALVTLQLVRATIAFAAEPQISIELNSGELADNKCRLTFVIENKNPTAIDTLKLDLVAFNKDNRVFQRFVADMGPVRGAKTIVKAYSVDGACSDLRSILINDVTACAPGKPDACLEDLALSSRMEGVRFFK